MAYKHILIAVDLSPESKVLVDKAVSMARPYNAKVSLIHVDVNYSDLYTGLIDVNLGDMQKRISEETHHALSELSTNAGYPITETLSGSGDLGQVLVDAPSRRGKPKTQYAAALRWRPDRGRCAAIPPDTYQCPMDKAELKRNYKTENAP